MIAATGGSELAAKAATNTIPIVFTTGADPVELGLVTSLNKPGGNVTGVTFLVLDLGTKRLGLLRHLRLTPPQFTLTESHYPSTAGEIRDVQAAAGSLACKSTFCKRRHQRRDRYGL